jgi:hypothetical protein
VRKELKPRRRLNILNRVLALLMRLDGQDATTAQINQWRDTLVELEKIRDRDFEALEAYRDKMNIGLVELKAAEGLEEKQAKLFEMEIEDLTTESIWHSLNITHQRIKVLLDDRFLTYACEQWAKTPEVNTLTLCDKFANEHHEDGGYLLELVKLLEEEK